MSLVSLARETAWPLALDLLPEAPLGVCSWFVSVCMTTKCFFLRPRWSRHSARSSLPLVYPAPQTPIEGLRPVKKTNRHFIALPCQCHLEPIEPVLKARNSKACRICISASITHHSVALHVARIHIATPNTKHHFVLVPEE